MNQLQPRIARNAKFAGDLEINAQAGLRIKKTCMDECVANLMIMKRPCSLDELLKGLTPAAGTVILVAS